MADLLKHALILVFVILGWFALASISHNIFVQVALGWLGFAVLALYFRWLHKNKPGAASVEGERRDER